MELNTVEQRHELINEMIDESFEFMQSVADDEDDNDWGGAHVTWENLVALERLIRTEEIFLDTFEEMGHVRTYDRDEQEVFISVFLMEGLNAFNETVFLDRLEHTAKNLREWNFRTERGLEFEKKFREKIDALLRKYQGLYDI